MNQYHIKDFYVDTSNQWLNKADGTKLYVQPSFFYGDTVLARFHTGIDLTGYTFLFGIDYSYQTSHSDLVRCDNTKFNPADWTSWSLATGDICCLVDTKSASWITYVGTNPYTIAYMDLWALSAEAPLLLVQQPIRIYNRISQVA